MCDVCVHLKEIEDQHHSLAVLVVIFADVAQVCGEGLHCEWTGDLPTFPLDNHPWKQDRKCHSRGWAGGTPRETPEGIPLGAASRLVMTHLYERFTGLVNVILLFHTLMRYITCKKPKQMTVIKCIHGGQVVMEEEWLAG